MESDEKEASNREAQNKLKDLKIITAILLGKKRNKELAQVLDTDKSFTSKKIKSLEEQGLVVKSGEGKETRYEVNEFNVLDFLQRRVVIKVGKEKKEDNQDGKTI
jgi:Mn-dependent DtxR family transcriptional regulator